MSHAAIDRKCGACELAVAQQWGFQPWGLDKKHAIQKGLIAKLTQPLPRLARQIVTTCGFTILGADMFGERFAPSNCQTSRYARFSLVFSHLPSSTGPSIWADQCLWSHSGSRCCLAHAARFAGLILQDAMTALFQALLSPKHRAEPGGVLQVTSTLHDVKIISLYASLTKVPLPSMNSPHACRDPCLRIHRGIGSRCCFAHAAWLAGVMQLATVLLFQTPFSGKPWVECGAMPHSVLGRLATQSSQTIFKINGPLFCCNCWEFSCCRKNEAPPVLMLNQPPEVIEIVLNKRMCKLTFGKPRDRLKF